MKAPRFSQASTAELIQRFRENCVAQDEALLYGDIAKCSRLVLEMRDIDEELAQRPGDQRRALVPLFDHDNAQVRLQAARVAFAVAPVEARRTIEAIAKSKKGPQNGDAGMTLTNLDRGVFKPT